LHQVVFAGMLKRIGEVAVLTAGDSRPETQA
jgi:hypothetical protein